MDGCHLKGRLQYPLASLYSIVRTRRKLTGLYDMANKIDLAGRNAVVTGGAQGIGRAITERFLDSGAAVAIWDRDVKFAEKTAQEFGNRGKVAAIACDVTNLADVERARDDSLKAFGRIDILVNNAGIAGKNATTWDYPAEEWRQVMRPGRLAYSSAVLKPRRLRRDRSDGTAASMPCGTTRGSQSGASGATPASRPQPSSHWRSASASSRRCSV